jgi:hypothetical protein
VLRAIAAMPSSSVDTPQGFLVGLELQASVAHGHLVDRFTSKFLKIIAIKHKLDVIL